MNEILIAIRALVDDRAGFNTQHPSLAAWTPIEIGHVARALVRSGVLVKGRDGYSGRVYFRGAHLPKPARKDARQRRAVERVLVHTPRTASSERLVDIARRLATNPKGFRTLDPAFEGVSASSIGCSLQHMVQRGELFKVRVTHKLVLFFGSKVDAEASIVHFQHQVLVLPSARVVATISPHHRVAADAPADTSRAKLTVCPPFVPRNVALDVLCPLLRQAPYRRAA